MSVHDGRSLHTSVRNRRALTRYRVCSWIDPRIERRHSPIEGTGLFATAPIGRGEIAAIWGGTLFSDAEIRAGVARERSCVLIAEGLHLGSFAHEVEGLDEFMNHSCDPNVWLQDEVTLLTRTEIAPGQELTIDYALWETDPGWIMPCFCQTEHCREYITGNDWKSKKLQRLYENHFSPYVNLRITRLLNHDRELGRMHKLNENAPV